MIEPMSQHLVDALIDLLDLEPIEVNIFRGVNPDEDRQRIFGGQVAGQALVAAARTVDDDRACLLYTSPSPRDLWISRMPSSA